MLVLSHVLGANLVDFLSVSLLYDMLIHFTGAQCIIKTACSEWGPLHERLIIEMVDVANTKVTSINEHPDYALLIRAPKYAHRITFLYEAVKASSHHYDIYDNISNTVHDFMLMG